VYQDHFSKLLCKNSILRCFTKIAFFPRSIDNDKVIRGRPINRAPGAFPVASRSDARSKAGAAEKSQRLKSLPAKKEDHGKSYLYLYSQQFKAFLCCFIGFQILMLQVLHFQCIVLKLWRFSISLRNILFIPLLATQRYWRAL